MCIKPDKASRQLDKNAVQCGELLVRGPTVCKQYFGNGDATAEAFDSDGWFRTGDIASVNSEEDYRIVGRASMDILKTAGYKVSALEVERELRVHPGSDKAYSPDAPYLTSLQRSPIVPLLACQTPHMEM